MRGLLLRNNSTYTGREGKTDWWEWTAYIDADADQLKEVDYIEYHLHQSFRRPIRRVKRRAGGFPLTMRGWGTFELVAKVVWKDRTREPELLRHMLEFADSE
ncbi:MAG: pYEATS domain-containing protein [Planctomycetota bacterium]